MPDPVPGSAAPQPTTKVSVSVVPHDDGWNVFVQRPGFPLNTLSLPDVEAAHTVVAAITDALKDRAYEHPQTFTVHFTGGPWDSQTAATERIVAPVFAAGHVVGNHYYLDIKSDPPTYFWDGTEWGDHAR